MVAVYLGLVLAGATPQVLAQAATAKQFNVKDEIEAKRDIDDQPDPTFDELVAGLDAFSEDHLSWLSDCRLHLDYDDKSWASSKRTAIQLKYDRSELLYKIVVEKSTHERADSLYKDLSRALQVFEPEDDDATLKVLFANTRLSQANDQISVITRLPRADLDPLLAFKR